MLPFGRATPQYQWLLVAFLWGSNFVFFLFHSSLIFFLVSIHFYLISCVCGCACFVLPIFPLFALVFLYRDNFQKNGWRKVGERKQNKMGEKWTCTTQSEREKKEKEKIKKEAEKKKERKEKENNLRPPIPSWKVRDPRSVGWARLGITGDTRCPEPSFRLRSA